jgi:hypothetical protein
MKSGDRVKIKELSDHEINRIMKGRDNPGWLPDMKAHLGKSGTLERDTYANSIGSMCESMATQTLIRGPLLRLSFYRTCPNSSNSILS